MVSLDNLSKKREISGGFFVHRSDVRICVGFKSLFFTTNARVSC